MPESGVTKHNYLFCQFVNPARGHEGDRCDCFDTPSQRRTTLAKQRLARLRANREINRASTSNDPESAVASDPAVTDTGKEDFLGVVTMEVLDLDRDLMDANLIRRDVREVVASGSQGDVTRCGSGFAIGVRDRGVIWLGGTELIDERGSGDRDRDDRGQLCTG